MSTKLHHGYRLAEGVDPFDFLATVRAHIDPVRDRADARVLAERADAIVDRAAAHGLTTHAGDDLADLMKTPLTSVYLAYEDEQAKLRETDRRHDPNRFELSFGRDPQTGRYAVLRFVDEDLDALLWFRDVQVLHQDGSTTTGRLGTLDDGYVVDTPNEPRPINPVGTSSADDTLGVDVVRPVVST